MGLVAIVSDEKFSTLRSLPLERCKGAFGLYGRRDGGFVPVSYHFSPGLFSEKSAKKILSELKIQYQHFTSDEIAPVKPCRIARKSESLGLYWIEIYLSFDAVVESEGVLAIDTVDSQGEVVSSDSLRRMVADYINHPDGRRVDLMHNGIPTRAKIVQIFINEIGIVDSPHFYPGSVVGVFDLSAEPRVRQAVDSGLLNSVSFSVRMSYERKIKIPIKHVSIDPFDGRFDAGLSEAV